MASMPFFVPQNVKRAVRRATDVDPDKRFQNASDFMNQLNALTTRVVDWRFVDETVVAVSKDSRYRLRRKDSQFVVEQDKGSGWRKLPNLQPSSLTSQLKVIASRALPTH
jgi:eukaryotic-like serine/threonine-protein kinase